jgi:hypothetical protein
MIWMKSGAATEDDGTICQVSIIDPSEGIQKSLDNGKVSQVAQDILRGKSQSWQEFHPKDAADAKIRGVTFVRIDFDGTRNENSPKIHGFQMLAPVKEKLVCVTVQAPEAARAELDTFTETLKSLQVQ